MNNFINKFKLLTEEEEVDTVITTINNGVVFRGTSLWILIFAIFVASLGLNVNSTAVIIGAMLISPLMGPIMGMGLGIGINDVTLLKTAFYNYSIATFAALATSTIFFLLSPLNEAHSEILARTSPTIYDVLIALFGGLAGIVATSSKHKGNVLPGVAIATALMPPLCTAGYGLATLQFSFFWGAFYLFIINTVFIALATFIIVRLLDFPYKHAHTKRAEQTARRTVWGVTLLTLLPSLYFGYDMVEQNRFTKNAERFINYEAHFTNDYLLNKKIEPKEKRITLIFGGKEITPAEIAQLKGELKQYQLENATLEIKQGFAYLAENSAEQNDQLKQLTEALNAKDKALQQHLDSIGNQQKLSGQVFAELKAQYPQISSASVQPITELGTPASKQATYLVLLTFTNGLQKNERVKLENWLKIRLQQQSIRLIIQ